MKRTITMSVIAVSLCGMFAALVFFKPVNATTAAAGEQYKLDKRPQKTADVRAAREKAKDDQAIAVVGRIGGSKQPWIEGLAAFSLVDRSLTPCNEIEGDTCPTPWDYCCAAELPQATVLVKFVDDSGRIVREDARQLLGVEALQHVVVTGKALRDEAGNVSIAASGIYIVEPQQRDESP